MTNDLQNSTLYEEAYHQRERRSNFRFLAVILTFFLLFFGFRLYWTSHFGGVRVDGPSMLNTLVNGEQLIMRYANENNPAKRGDIIVVDVSGYEEVRQKNEGKAPEDQLKFIIKRLIATEGDVVKCTAGQVEVKYAGEEEFTKLVEPYAHYSSAAKKAEYNFSEYTVGKGQIFFLGDNRNNSIDSRYNQENGSNLHGRLYEAKDVVGVVPTWAIENQSILEKIFF